MTRSRQTQLWALLALLAFSLPIFQALLSREIICTDDLTVHIHKAYALQELIESGHPLARWSPDLARGYGYPWFNFYAPLSSYPLAMLGLVGLPYPLAAQFTLVLMVWLAGVGMYACARNLFGPVPALAAAIAYLYAPYLGYDIFFRGALAEVLAWVWIPFCLWGLRVAIQRASWRWAAFAAVSYAALLPSHNLAALLATPLLGAWVVAVTLETKQLHRVWFGVSALGLGLGLAAAFWVPALAERDLVHTERLLDSPLLQYDTNFIQVGELLAGPQRIDPALANPSPPRALGLVPAVFAALGLLALGRKQAPRLLIGLLAIALVSYGLMTLAVSQPIWGLVPLLKFAQFPWRMLTPAAACAALLAGAGVSAWGKAMWPLTILASVVVAGSSIGWFTPSYCAPEADLRAGMLAEGSFGYSEYLPSAVKAFPADDSLNQQLTSGVEPDRLQSPGQVMVQAADPLNAAYQVTESQAAEAVYRQFYYPGWQVTIDNQPVALNLTDDGLIRFTMPAGTHVVRVSFGETPLRAGMDVISLVTLVFLIGLAWRGQTRAENIETFHPSSLRIDDRRERRNVSTEPLWAQAGFVCVGLAVSMISLTINPLQQSRFDGQAVKDTTPIRASFVGGVEVYGADIPVVRSGESFDVTVYAGVREKIVQRFVPAITVEDDSGLQWNAPQTDFARWLRPPFTANDWQPGQYALWARKVQLLEGTPPGNYTVWLTVYDADTNAVDSVLGADGNPVGPRLKLGTLKVERPIRIGGAVTGGSPLMGEGSVDRAEARAGDTALVTVLWQVNQPAVQTEAVIELLDSSNIVKASQSVSVGQLDWAAGDRWRGQYLFRLPADLADGVYAWRVALSGGDSLALGTIKITAPQRTFMAPDIQTRVGAQFGNFAELTGYTLTGEAKPGNTVTLTLLWEATATPNQTYSVFVHVMDAKGHLWAQNDSGPQQWNRPTTGWLAGEYILDDHPLNLPNDLPAGDYTLYVGLADAATGQRATVTGPGAGDDGRVAIGTLKVPR